jgi:hypothetical protein
MQTFKQVKVVICSGQEDKNKPYFKTVLHGNDYDDIDEFIEAIADTAADDIECVTEKIEGN